MSDCKHEPIEVDYGLVGENGERYMQVLLFSDPQPPVQPLRGFVRAVAASAAVPQTTRYALMGCRHCKAPFIDVIPPVRVVKPNTDPFRTEGG